MRRRGIGLKASSISRGVPRGPADGAGAFTIIVTGRGCDGITNMPLTLGSNLTFSGCYRGALNVPTRGIHCCTSTSCNAVLHTVHSVGGVTDTFGNSVGVMFCCTNRNVPGRSAGSTCLLPASTSNARARNYCSLGGLCTRLNSAGTGRVIIFLSTYFDNSGHRRNVLTSTHNMTLGTGRRSPHNGVIMFDTTSNSRATFPCSTGKRNLFACCLLGGLRRAGNSMDLNRLRDCVSRGIGRRSIIVGHGIRAPATAPSASLTTN